MAGGKETPRQKMIGMMYLVLTALLALNVSKDILNAFVVVNDGLTKTTTIIEDKNSNAYEDFAISYEENKLKTKPFYDAAQAIRQKADELDNHVDMMKVKLISKTDKVPEEMAKLIADSLMSLNSKDNYDIPTSELIGENVGSPKDGEFTALDLKKRIEAFKDEVISLVKTANPRVKLDPHDLGLDTEETIKVGDEEQDWINTNFYHIPLVAVVTNLSKIQADVRNIEADMVKLLYSSVDAGSFKFNKIEPLAISESDYVLQGDTFRSNIFLAASDSTKDPEIILGNFDSTALMKGELKWIDGEGTPLDVVNGKGKYVAHASEVGIKTISGVIKFPDPKFKGEDRYLYYPFRKTYNVAKPSAVVSATKMNVLYIGVENPLSISAAGVAEKDIQASISQGSLRKGGKEWVARVSKTGSANVTVFADMDGEKVRMGTMEFRVKRVPDPVAVVGKVEGEGDIRKNELKVLPGIAAKMKNFDFDLKFDITGFEMVAAGKGIESIPMKATNGRFTPQMKRVFNSLATGHQVFFQQIRARGPDGSTRKLSPISVTIAR